MFTTKTKLNTSNAKFNERFSSPICCEVHQILIRVFHVIKKRKIILGEVIFDIDDVVTEISSRHGLSGVFPLSLNSPECIFLPEITSQWMNSKNPKKIPKTLSKFGSIEIQLRFLNDLIILKDTNDQNIRNNSATDISLQTKNSILPSYFPPNFGDSYQIYLSSHQPGTSGVLPGIVMNNNEVIEARSCYRDLSIALKRARTFICISTWSMNTKLRLIRAGDGAASEPCIGDLLKKRAKDGVCVMILLFDNNTKSRKLAQNSNDVKLKSLTRETHVKETMSFFRGSGVICVKSKSTVHKKLTKDMDLKQKKLFEHYMGMIVVDSPKSTLVKLQVKKHKTSQKIPKIAAFLGGIDITTGRYDDCDKSLFESLNSVHSNDFFNSSNNTSIIRQPWQDMYVKIEGKSAADCLQIFFEQWNLQTRSLVIELNKKKRIYALKRNLVKSGYASTVNKRRWFTFGSNKEDVSERLATGEQADSDEEDKLVGNADVSFDEDIKTYNSMIQLLRSCDATSSKLRNQRFPILKRHKGICVDTSLHDNIIHQITLASKFIYMEAEWLIGSTESLSYGSIFLSQNMIPSKLVYKIISMAEQKQPFHVYIVLPIYPEGSIQSNETKLRVQLQRDTLKYMLVTLQKKITDLSKYISLLSLAKKEVIEINRMVKIPILVKSNTCIFDDKVMIVSSAGFSDRTLVGNKDTVLGVLVSDLTDVKVEHGRPTNMIQVARMQLWSEHLGASNYGNKFVVDQILSPHKERCVKYVQGAAKDGLEAYCSSDPLKKMKSNFIAYPLQINAESNVPEVIHKESFENFAISTQVPKKDKLVADVIL